MIMLYDIVSGHVVSTTVEIKQNQEWKQYVKSEFKSKYLNK